MLLGYPPVHEGNDVASFDDFVADFDWSKVSPAGPVFDMDKLNWLNGAYIRQLEPTELAQRIIAYANEFQSAGWGEREANVVTAAVPLIQERLVLLADAKDQVAFLLADDADIVIADDARAQLREDSPQVIDAAVEVLTTLPTWTADAIQSALKEKLVTEMGIKARFAFAPLRVALSGQKVSPPLFESMEILGRDSTLRRLKALS
ncbi:malonyl-CoA synthase [Platysternon megacephalum]|uniref:Malonyl-CoA synthase n=1 Tax=Platysternon megacephalum TaxID=55544 RepID=A0A4D9DFL3_9SAUR|nr:malonyl-CoA synthase [Platysternon megacephalum]